MYLLISWVEETSAVYITDSLRHSPPTGQAAMPCLQLQLAFCLGFWLSIFLLCLERTLAMFGRQLYDILTLFLLNNLCRGLFLGKCLFIIVRKLWPILVATSSFHGGWNQIIFLVLICFYQLSLDHPQKIYQRLLVLIT